MKISINTNARVEAAKLQGFADQVPFATAVALTRTAKDAQKTLSDEMSRVFDKPTTYTLRSLYVRSATKKRLEARVWLKDDAGKGTPADRYLLPQIEGGTRRAKGMEAALTLRGLMQKGWVAVPAAGAQMDANGNVKRSQIVQILSQLQAQRVGGYDAAATGSKRSNRSIARQGVTYFALPVAKNGLPAGVYMKRKLGFGTAIRPVFIFVSQATYRVRFKFFELGDDVVRGRFPVHFEAELAKAISTARLRGPA